MLLFLLFVINYLIKDHECYIGYKAEPNQVNEANAIAVEAILRKYLKPLKKLSESLPGHNIELQLEVVTKPPGQARHKKIIQYPKKPDFRVLEHEAYYPQPHHGHLKHYHEQHKNKQISGHGHDAHRGHKTHYNSKRVPGQNQEMDYQGRARKAAEKVTVSDSIKETTATLVKLKASETTSSLAISSSTVTPSQIQTSTDEPVHEEENFKKPVYMDDLKKALEDFEKRFYEKQTNTPADPRKNSIATATEIDEGKQPLLKKDLWMALGMKFMSGCDRKTTQSTDLMTTRNSVFNPINSISNNANQGGKSNINNSPYNPDGSYNQNYNHQDPEHNKIMQTNSPYNEKNNGNNIKMIDDGISNSNAGFNSNGQFAFDQNTVISGLHPRINKIMQLLKKGVRVEREYNKPGEDLQWLQVKIPKNI